MNNLHRTPRYLYTNYEARYTKYLNFVLLYFLNDCSYFKGLYICEHKLKMNIFISLFKNCFKKFNFQNADLV